VLRDFEVGTVRPLRRGYRLSVPYGANLFVIAVDILNTPYQALSQLRQRLLVCMLNAKLDFYHLLNMKSVFDCWIFCLIFTAILWVE